MSLHEVEFPASIAQGAVGGPTFHTTIVGTISGREERNVDWNEARLRWDISTTLTTPAKKLELVEFFRARKGRAHGFLFRDWSDWYVGMAYVANVLTHTGPHNFATGNGVQTVFKIYRIYTSGGQTDTRRISRPMSAIKVYVNNVEVVSGYSVNYSTGTITFDVAPTNGHAIGWSGKFRVPARFDSDELNLQSLSVTSGGFSATIVEIRED